LNLFGDPTVEVSDVAGLFIQHTPLQDTELTKPYQVDAVITSTEGSITSARLYWSTGGDYEYSDLNLVENDLFRAYIPAQPLCTTVDYYLYAIDSASNVRWYPTPPETITFKIATYTELYHDTIEDGPQDWTHSTLTTENVDQWSIRDHRNHTPEGSFSWKFGSRFSSGYAF